jgi:hypothetical protein
MEFGESQALPFIVTTYNKYKYTDITNKNPQTLSSSDSQ